MRNIETLIEDLQIAFSDIEKPIKIKGCDCGSCLDQNQCDDLLALSDSIEVTLDDASRFRLLCDYIEDALFTVGVAEDFIYFVPKVLGLCLRQYDFLENPTMFVNKLTIAGFDNWSASKKMSVEAVLLKVVELGIHGRSSDFDDWMSGLCALDVSHQKFMDLLDRDEAEVSRKSFIRCHYPESWEGPRMKGPYWDDLPSDKTQIVHNWLVSQPPA